MNLIMLTPARKRRKRGIMIIDATSVPASPPKLDVKRQEDPAFWRETPRLTEKVV